MREPADRGPTGTEPERQMRRRMRMSIRRLRHLAAGLALLAALALPGPVGATSCIPIEMQLRDLGSGNAVFVATVVAREAAAVRVRVDQWYSGSDPRDVFLIPINLPGQPVIIGSWEPTPGQQWFIIGDRVGPETIDSGVCRQVPIDANILAMATGAFGQPQLPPFADPAGGGDGTLAGPSPLLWGGVIGLGILAGLGAILLIQRRSRARPPG